MNILTPEQTNKLVLAADKVHSGTGSHTTNFNTEIGASIFDEAAEVVVEDLEFYPNPLGVFGGAQGWDALCACIYREQTLPYVLILPEPGYGNWYWGGHDKRNPDKTDHRALFAAMCEAAVGVEYVCKTPAGNKPGGKYGDANLERNDRMVELAKMAKAATFLVYDSGSSGTANCFRSIEAANLSYVRWEPDGVAHRFTAVRPKATKPAPAKAKRPAPAKAAAPVTATAPVAQPIKQAVATATTTRVSNKYSGRCPVCHQIVETGKGNYKRVNGVNVVFHQDCKEPYLHN